MIRVLKVINLFQSVIISRVDPDTIFCYALIIRMIILTYLIAKDIYVFDSTSILFQVM